MDFFTWKPEYSVNISEIDAQHKKLVELLNNIYLAMKVGKGREVMAGVIDELVSYTQIHFSTEEGLMRQTNYPNFDAHKAEHDQFVAKVQQFQSEFQSNQVGMTIEVASYIKNWLINHIQRTDRVMAAHLLMA